MDKHDNLNDIDKTIDEIIKSTKQRNMTQSEIDEDIAKSIDEDIENDISEAKNSGEAAAKSTDPGAKAAEKPPKKRLKLTKVQKAIIIAVAAVVVLFAAVFGGIAIKTQDNPFTYTASVIKNSKADLVGNWESDSAPGLSAYVFNEDGTYDSYISSYNFSGQYTATPNTLTLINTLTGQEVTYKYSISGDALKLTLIEENGTEIEDDETVQYNKVSQLNQKSISDIISSLQTDSSDSE
ncbi:MAG: DUF5640 domain-containing protein [Clostridiales bacterium]|nr:DUF5640 domain-containing protein [Clostridiales bacterium]